MARAEIPFVTLDTAGNITRVHVTITHRPGGGLASIYAKDAGEVTAANPTQSDTTGRIKGFLEEGSYNITFGPPLDYTRAMEIVVGSAVGNVGAGAITATKVADGTLTGSKLKDNVVAAAKIADNAITEAKLADGTITGTQLAANSIATAKIADNSLSSRVLANSTITPTEIGAGAVTSAALNADSVTNAKILDSSARDQKIAENSITGNKIAMSAITGSKLNNDLGARVMGEALPVGTILAYLGNTLPNVFGTHWYWCNGQVLNPNLYPDLYGVIQYKYGKSGTNFALPDLQGRGAPGWASGGNAAVNNIGCNESGPGGINAVPYQVPWNVRYPQHAHHGGGLVTTGGGHDHTTERPNDAGKGAYTMPASASWIPDRRFLGAVYHYTSGSLHNHGVAGHVGDTGGTAEAPPYFVVNYIIRIQ